jgi:hypothetical protein
LSAGLWPPRSTTHDGPSHGSIPGP